ncbi:hypothetical protein CFter6_4390 [Collimonas fungivorans]|uniref:Uncharacterized protein n=2 Tax=Collimonas fungivorans TaxID=158899 RepID=G0ADC5_COLFT|nr:hypothetical protein [Collimonas fungivorans]AEK63387.1 hypothetical protein CFU_3563 [Collimonas fungivorans Ter331]AMO96984.1 hypothetical protein CFter6_4390 [Collimonas fungivorans]
MAKTNFQYEKRQKELEKKKKKEEKLKRKLEKGSSTEVETEDGAESELPASGEPASDEPKQP